jgi:ribosomal protein L10
VFLQHTDFTAQRLLKLRREIETASSRALPSITTPASNPTLPVNTATLTVIRTGIFGVALRDFGSVDLREASEFAKSVHGPLAVLTLPSLHPPQLDSILRALDRAVPPKKPKTEQELAKELEEKNADPATPGRKIKRRRPILTPELKLVGALMEGKFFKADAVHCVANLPTLDTLRAQLIGLLSSPSTQLASVLSEASGGKLARALEGLKKGLEERQDREVVS